MTTHSTTNYAQALAAVVQEVVPGLEFYYAKVVHEVQRTTTLYLVALQAEGSAVGGYELKNYSDTSDLYEDGSKWRGFSSAL